MAINTIDISVVITVYNIEKYIGECLDSVLIQREKEIEVICVDDASTDHSVEVLKKYEAQDERVRVLINEKNIGAGSSRNIGCRAARGKYLYVIDGDDLLVEGGLAKLYECAEEYRLDILSFEGETFWDDDLEWNGDRINRYHRTGKYEGIYKGPEIFALYFKNHDITGNTYMNFINKKFFVENDLFWTEGVRYNSDSVFAFYMVAERVMCIPDILYKRRYRAKSLVTAPLKGIYLPGAILQFLRELDIWDRSENTGETDVWIEKYFRMMHSDINRIYQTTQGEHMGDLLETSKRASYFYHYFIEKKPLYQECITDEDINKIKSAERIILYGAGSYGEKVADVLEYYGIMDYEVAVTSVNNSTMKFHGKVIRNITDLVHYRDVALVIIAVGEKWQNEMIKVLEMNGFRNYVICSD
ncbi:MAG: glycosyltransferase family 2 protein [Dorea sp.]|nr:glycosyltransferase family 2 protein [Dorea sp.]